MDYYNTSKIDAKNNQYYPSSSPLLLFSSTLVWFPRCHSWPLSLSPLPPPLLFLVLVLVLLPSPYCYYSLLERYRIGRYSSDYYYYRWLDSGCCCSRCFLLERAILHTDLNRIFAVCWRFYFLLLCWYCCCCCCCCRPLVHSVRVRIWFLGKKVYLLELCSNNAIVIIMRENGWRN